LYNGISTLNLLEIVEKVTRKIAPGPVPSFNEAHVIKALELIGDSRYIGRIRLSKELALGEGTTRTLIKHLKKKGIVQSSRKGISFTEEGNKLFFELQNKISPVFEIPKSKLTLGPYNVAILVRDLANAVGTGMEQRDIAIRSGASGATTLIFTRNKLSLPSGEENLSESLPGLHNKLVTQFKPRENDVIIVGCGKNEITAEIGARMAAIDLLRNT
jgi:hypothetical protein